MLAKHILGIDLDATKWKVAIGSIDRSTNQIIIEHIGSYSNTDDLKQILSKYSIAKTIYSVSNQYSVSYVANLLNNLTLDTERNARRIDNNQNVDYFNFGSNSLLTALPKSNVADISVYHQSLGLKQPFSINSTDIELGYLLKRNYLHHQSLTVAIIHFQQEHTGISIYQDGSIKHVTWIDLEQNTTSNKATNTTNSDDINNTANIPNTASTVAHNVQPATATNTNNLVAKVVKALLSSTRYCDPTVIDANETERFNFHYNLVLIAGLSLDNINLELRTAASAEKLKLSDIEFIEPLRSSFININSLSDHERIELERNGHQYAVAIESIAMSAENLGVDLALPTADYKNNKLDKKVPINFEIKVIENAATKLAMAAIANAKLIVPSLVSQKYLLLFATLTCLVIAGYRYYNYNNEIADIQNDYTSEKNRETLLLTVKNKYEDLQNKNKSKNELITSIKNIQKTQMLVPTIMGDIQNLSYRTTFRGLITISELDIAGTDIKIAGKALDKFRVAAFASELQSSNYEDVIPAKYTAVDNIQGTYEIVTKYTGNIPKNPVLLPQQSPIQLININQINNQNNQVNQK